MARRGIKLRVVPGVTTRRLRTEFGDDRHADDCVACGYFDRLRSWHALTGAAAEVCANHILTEHEPVG